jgi:transcription elongation factor
MATMNKRTNDPLRGKEVLITAGQYKGYRGRVCNLDDRQALVELSSICKKIPISRDYLKDLAKVQAENGGAIGISSTRDEDMNAGGRTVYEGGRTAYEGNKTPMQYNTPSYYPNGQKWAGNNSPGFGTEYAGRMSPGLSRPGSEHMAGETSTRGPANSPWVKRE